MADSEVRKPKRIQRKRMKGFDRKAWLHSLYRPKAVCHPDRNHRAHGLCDSCYGRWLYENSEVHREQKKATNKRWKDANVELVRTGQRAQKLRIKYGITPEQYDLLFAEQQGLCAICQQSGMPLHVDHDHENGKVRGLLCLRCNGSLAWVEMILRNSPWVSAARSYLEEHAKTHTTKKG